MKRLRIVLTTAYWLVVAALPFLPIYLDLQLEERIDCTLANGCLQHAIPFISEMGVSCALSALILWPLCVWNLGGRWLWHCARDARRNAA